MNENKFFFQGLFGNYTVEKNMKLLINTLL